jgi:hypothetical protein
MKKYAITVTETLEYTRNLTVEVPDELDDETFNELLDDVEGRVEGASEIPYVLARRGIKTIDNPSNDFSSPRSSEIEIDDCSPVEEDE